MSDDEVRERSPLHEAGPQDWPHGAAGVADWSGPASAASAAGPDRDRLRLRKVKRNERDTTVRFKKLQIIFIF